MVSEIDKVLRALEKVTTQVVKKITLDVTANLRIVTPVDTGWARANWIPTIGTPASSRGNPASRADKLSGASAASAEQSASMGNVASSYTISQGKTFVTNNVPYIQKLNNGSSQKAPAGFVQGAIQKAILVDIKNIRSLRR